MRLQSGSGNDFRGASGEVGLQRDMALGGRKVGLLAGLGASGGESSRLPEVNMALWGECDCRRIRGTPWKGGSGRKGWGIRDSEGGNWTARRGKGGSPRRIRESPARPPNGAQGGGEGWVVARAPFGRARCLRSG